MSTMLDRISDVQDDDGRFVVMPPEPVFALDELAPLDDQYADCELKTRHERTERLIRQAQEQA